MKYRDPRIGPTLLRSQLEGHDPVFIMEAHDGLSAKIACNAGFRAIWASGLSISSSLGRRDANEVSWSEALTIVTNIVEAASAGGAAVVVDGDSGHGDFNNARLYAAKLASIGAAGVCFEDKLYPKMNSYLSNEQLADVAEFSGRIAAAKHAVTGSDFVIVARTEALIAGLSLDEAIGRAKAYRAAGADGILIHSKKRTAEEVLAFANRWDDPCPLFIVPTSYPDVPVSLLTQSGIKGIIWANQNLRAAALAMERVCNTIMKNGSVAGLEDEIMSLEALFNLMDYEELFAAQSQYQSGTAFGSGQKDTPSSPAQTSASPRAN